MPSTASQKARSGKSKQDAADKKSARKKDAPKKGGKKKDKTKAKKKRGFTASQVDKHDLYEQSVQNPKEDVRFLDRVFRKERDRRPETLKEDFCGTAWMCAEWVRSRPERHAMGVDLCSDTQEWGRRKHLDPLGEDAARVQLLTENVLSVTEPKVDVVVAFNFSYCIFRERPQLKEYFQAAYDSLGPDGVFAVDIHGGPESIEELEEQTDHKDFTYVWDQGPIDPVSHRTHRAIHFRFPDGTRIKNAYTYDWRVWSLPELKELMEEIGFSRVDVYWEGYDKKGEGNGIFRKVQTAENDDSWIAYVVGWK